MAVGPHFGKFICTDPPIEWSSLEELRQREFIKEIDQPISWDELRAAVTKLKNDNLPGLKNLPLNSFKDLNNENLTQLL